MSQKTNTRKRPKFCLFFKSLKNNASERHKMGHYPMYVTVFTKAVSAVVKLYFFY